MSKNVRTNQLVGKIIISVIIAVAVLIVVNFDTLQTKGKNCRIIRTDNAVVSYQIKCPKCSHIYPTKYINISKGEKYSSTYLCSYCYEFFEYSINR